MRKKEKDIERGQGRSRPRRQPASTAASKLISPLDIQQKEFRVARFGGYKMRDVDEFLDQVTESMSAARRGERAAAQGGGAAPRPWSARPTWPT